MVNIEFPLDETFDQSLINPEEIYDNTPGTFSVENDTAIRLAGDLITKGARVFTNPEITKEQHNAEMHLVWPGEGRQGLLLSIDATQHVSVSGIVELPESAQKIAARYSGKEVDPRCLPQAGQIRTQ